jgi:1-phosphofructokinase family hexose kinase
MILSVCPNTSLDRVVLIDKWTPGMPIRTNQFVTTVGGKGLNSAVVLDQLGVETVAIGFFAGVVGQELLTLLGEYKIKAEPIWVDGENRVSLVVCEKETHSSNTIISGEVQVSRKQKNEFVKKLKSYLPLASFVILAGTIPPSINPDFYAELISLAHQANVPVLVDAQKQFMVETIKYRPEVVKMNWEEFKWTFDVQAATIPNLISAAQAFHTDHQLKSLVITLGKEGILSITPQGTYLANAPIQIPVNTIGAGDAVSAALVWRLTQGDSWESAMRWGCAVSAANVITLQTADISLTDLKWIYPQVEVKLLD